jgi:hypothetical protein
VDELSGFLPFDVTLTGVRLYDPDGGLVARLGSVRTDFDPWALFDTKVVLSDLVVTDPEITLLDARGEVGFARALALREPPVDDTPSPWTVTIDRARLAEGTLRRVLPMADLGLEDLSVDLTLKLTPQALSWPKLAVRATAVGQSPLAAMLGGELTVATSGRLEGEQVILEGFDASAGPHAVEILGALTVGPEVGGTLAIPRVRVDLERLPPEWRRRLGGPLQVASGRGAVSFSGAEGSLARAEIDVDTPLGWVSVQVDAVMGDARGRVREWNLDARLLDVRPTEGLKALMPEGVRDVRSDLVVEAHGVGLPAGRAGDGGALSASAHLLERHHGRTGRMRLELARREDRADRSIFEISVGLEDLQLHPWLELFGETDLRVALPSVSLEGEFALPREGLPEVAATGHFEASATGTLRAVAPAREITAERIYGAFDGRWVGSGLPRARVVVEGRGLGFGGYAAKAIALGVELVEREGSPALVGTVDARAVSWPGGRVARVEVPLDVDAGRALSRAEGAWGRVGVGVEGLEMAALQAASGRVDVDVSRAGPSLSVRGRVRGEAWAVAQGSLGALELSLAGAVPMGLVEGAEGGPTRVALSGALREPKFGAYRATAVTLDDLVLRLPLGQAGVRGAFETDGRIEVVGPSTPVGAAERAEVRLMAGVFWPTLALSGSAAVEVNQAVAAGGQQVERAVVAARGLGTEVALDLEAVGGARGAQEPAVMRAHGRVTVPFKRAFEATLEHLDLRWRGAVGGTPRPWLELERAVVGADGWFSVGALTLRSPRAPGEVRVAGRFRPEDGRVEVAVGASDVVVKGWLAHLGEVLEGFGGKGLPSGLATEVDGVLGVEMSAEGTLGALSFKADFHGRGIAWRGLSGATVDLGLKPIDGGHGLEVGARWSEQAKLELKATLPTSISLSPPRLVWEEDRPMAIDLVVLEPDLAQGARLLQSVLSEDAPIDIGGDLDLHLKTGGTARAPTMNVAAFAKRFRFGEAFADGTLVLDGSASHEASGFRIELADARDALQAQLDVQLPFALPRMLVVDDPLGWVRERLENRSFLFELDLPDLVIAETPFAGLWPSSFAEMRARVDLTLGGTLLVPMLEGDVRLGAASPVPADVKFDLNFDTVSGGLIESRFAAEQVNGTPLLKGLLSFPSLSLVLRHPSRFREVFMDPRLKLELSSAELRPSALWDLDPGLGDLMRTLFPDGRFMADLQASGSEDGLVASLIGTVETEETFGWEASVGPGHRNIADRVIIGVDVGKTLEARASFTQLVAGPVPNLTVAGGLEVSAARLLEGGVDLGQQRIVDGEVAARGFRLEGLAAAFRNVLGASKGSLDGVIPVTGTLGAPRFGDGLCAQFEPLDVVPLGLEEPRLALRLDFPGATRWRLEKAEACSSEEVFTAGAGCTLDRVPEGQGWRRSGFGLSVSGDVSSLEPAAMSLEGCMRLERYQALDTKSMKGRIDARIDLGGTVARPAIWGDIEVVDARLAPALASRNVRPIGPPLDVRFVRGPPVPRPVTKSVARARTPLDLDLSVSLPKDAVRIEPSMTLPLGEVRAVLFPYTPLGKVLSVRMRDGVLSLLGTVEVPKETVTLYGKNFSVDPDSRLVFRGDMANDPQLVFAARHNISYVDLSSIGMSTTNESEVVVRVTGTPLKPRLSFTSSPTMDETNILSVIALGVPAGGGAGLGEAVQSQLLTAMMGMATLQFARDFQRRLALDVMRVEARSMDPRETRLTVGKRLARDLMLYYDLDPSAREGEDVNAGSLEFRVSRFLSILARAGDSNDVSLELNLRVQDVPKAGTGRPRGGAPEVVK